MNNAAIYVRTGFTANATEAVINQIHECNEYAIKNGLIVTKTHIDIGKSANDYARDGLCNLLKDIGSGSINTVIVSEIARISRNQYLHYLLNTFQKHDVNLISSDASYDVDTGLSLFLREGRINDFNNEACNEV